jgi:spoIIIJ-associated protein
LSENLEQAPASEAPPAAPSTDQDAIADLEDIQADTAEDFLNGLLDVLDMDGEAEADIEDGAIMVDMNGPDMAVLIGRHGLTLEALQELTRATVQHKTSSHVRLTLDIDGYRERQMEILERKARSLAAKVRSEGRSIALDPMNAYERRIVHAALTEFEGVMTASEGEDPERHVVIKPA